MISLANLPTSITLDHVAIIMLKLANAPSDAVIRRDNCSVTRNIFNDARACLRHWRRWQRERWGQRRGGRR